MLDWSHVYFARTKIPVQKEPDILLSGPSTPPRAPSRDDFPIEVYLDNGLIFIETNGLSQNLYYFIYDENNSPISVTDYFISTNNVFVIDLCSLPTGSYTLHLLYEDNHYCGHFSIE